MVSHQQQTKMTSYNELPIVLTKKIFTYLRQERRQPPHVNAIKEMIDYIENGVIRYDDDCKPPIKVRAHVWYPYAHLKQDELRGEWRCYPRIFENYWENTPPIVGNIFNVWDRWRKNHFTTIELVTTWFVDIIEARMSPNDYDSWVDEPIDQVVDGIYPPYICVAVEWYGTGASCDTDDAYDLTIQDP